MMDVRVVAIIQARTDSTRLPGKVLKHIGGQTMLACVVRRTKAVSLLDEVVVATTVKPSDDAIVAESEQLSVFTFRGDEQDVLDRYYHAAKKYQAEAIVRITSDCPLIDPQVINHVISSFLEEHPDYASNTIERTYPKGLDTEIMTMAALERAWHEARKPYQRVHVTPYIYQNSSQFHLLSVKAKVDYSKYRWTVDTPEDLELVREFYARLDNNTFSWQDVLTLLAQEPELVELNRHTRQKVLEEC